MQQRFGDKTQAEMFVRQGRDHRQRGDGHDHPAVIEGRSGLRRRVFQSVGGRHDSPSGGKNTKESAIGPLRSAFDGRCGDRLALPARKKIAKVIADFAKRTLILHHLPQIERRGIELDSFDQNFPQADSIVAENRRG